MTGIEGPDFDALENGREILHEVAEDRREIKRLAAAQHGMTAAQRNLLMALAALAMGTHNPVTWAAKVRIYAQDVDDEQQALNDPRLADPNDDRRMVTLRILLPPAVRITEVRGIDSYGLAHLLQFTLA